MYIRPCKYFKKTLLEIKVSLLKLDRHRFNHNFLILFFARKKPFKSINCILLDHAFMWSFIWFIPRRDTFWLAM